uniref:Uncharacterized protein n=1 Tax=Anguilla anguilla TaxID=7936 RepID=A0A0E9SZR1_ANGAN
MVGAGTVFNACGSFKHYSLILNLFYKICNSFSQKCL